MTEQTYSWLIQAFAKKGDTKAVDEILSTMGELGIKPRQVTYGRLIDAYAENGDLESINKIINEMAENNVYPSSQTYVYMLESLAHGGHLNLLSTVWERIQNVECLAEDVKPLVLTCVINGYYDFAFELLQLTTQKTSSSKSSYHFYIERRLFNLLYYCRKNTNEYLKALTLTEKVFDQPPNSRLRYLIEFFVSKNDTDKAIDLIKELEPSQMKTQLFHPILRGAAAQKNVEAIVDVLQEMSNLNVPVDFYCTNIISPAVGEPGSEEHKLYATSLKGKEDIGIPFNTLAGLLQTDDCSIKELTSLVKNAASGDVFGSLVQIKKKVISEFNADDASQIMKLLQEKGMRDITILTFEIIKSLQTDAEVVEGMNFVKNLMELDVPISSETYTSVLRSLRRHGLSDEFFMFVRIMKEHGIEPDIHQYYQMLNMAAMVGNSMAAQFCFNKVVDTSEFKEMRPRLYNWLIKAYGKDSEANKVLPNYLRGNFSESAQKTINLFQEMKQAEYEPSPFTVSTVIRSYLQNGDFDGASQLIQEHGEDELKMNNIIQTDFIRAYITQKRYEDAELLFEKLKGESKVTLPQYNEMLRMYEIRGDVTKSESLYQEMLQSDFRPNASTYAVRIRTYLTAKQPERCIEIIEENISGKNDLRVELFMVVLRNLVPTGQVDCVKKMIDLIKKHHSSKVPPHRLNEALILVNIKAGNIEEASALLPRAEEQAISEEEQTSEPALNPYRKAAKSAHLDGDVDYIENLIKFLKNNDLYYQTLDTFYLLALNKMNKVDDIKQLYEERIAEGFQPTEKFMSLLQQIIEVRNLQDFTQRSAVVDEPVE
uniref:Leucine-rich PPR motif-containing protein, mitochondrial n=2 Tax=Clytia hemisphaerica TaxID=252671 RepID=A0A7M5WZT1_9CNID